MAIAKPMSGRDGARIELDILDVTVYGDQAIMINDKLSIYNDSDLVFSSSAFTDDSNLRLVNAVNRVNQMHESITFDVEINDN